MVCAKHTETVKHTGSLSNHRGEVWWVSKSSTSLWSAAARIYQVCFISTLRAAASLQPEGFSLNHTARLHNTHGEPRDHFRCWTSWNVYDDFHSAYVWNDVSSIKHSDSQTLKQLQKQQPIYCVWFVLHIFSKTSCSIIVIFGHFSK